MGANSLLSSGVWIIPLVLIATLGGLYWLVRRWQIQSESDLKEIRRELRRLQTHRRQLESLIATHGDLREPYGTYLENLRSLLNDIDAALAALDLQYVAVQEQARRLDFRSFQAVVGAPFFWYEVRRKLRQQKRDARTVDAGLEAGDELLGELDTIPWEAALEARRTQEIFISIQHILDELKEKGLHGPVFEAAVQQAEELEDQFEALPPLYLEGAQEQVLQQAEVENTIQVHAAVTKIAPEINELLNRTQGWQRSYYAALRNVGQMRQYLQALGARLKDLPPGLAMAETQRQYDGLTVIAHTLNATLNRLEADNLEAVSAEAGRVLTTAQEIDRQVSAARQALDELRNLLSDLQPGIRALSAQFAALGTAGRRPVRWGESRDQLTELSRQAKTIGPASQDRTPAETLAAVEEARKLNTQRAALGMRCAELERQHNELVEILESPEVKVALQWAPEARTLARQAGEYAPENWPRSSAVESLAADIEALESRVRRQAGPQTEAEPIPETEMGQRLEELRALARDINEQHKRVADIGGHLEELRSTEQAAIERLEETRRALQAVELLIRSNPQMEEIAAGDVKKLRADLDQQQQTLDERRRGLVEKKANSANQFVGRVHSSVQNWLNALDKDLSQLLRTLEEKTQTLERIAALDEPAMAEALRLAGEASGLQSEGRNRRSADLETLVGDLKRRSDLWQSIQAAIKRIEEVEEPVVTSYNEAQEYRQYAHEEYDELSAWVAEARGWPPTALSLAEQGKELAKIEAQWEALQAQPVKAINLVAQLGNMAARYHTVAVRSRQIAEKIAAERERVAELEDQIDEHITSWQAQYQAQRDNPFAAQEIRALIDELDRQRNELIHESRRGARNYNQVLQTLQSIQRKARLAQVEIDESTVIDINGREIPFGGR
ncbi:MAG TPA: hypothetical protein VLS48_07885 [Anaerolineales bacterium]|nr:hypothetical protein [Anaerolineales bacterium]